MFGKSQRESYYGSEIAWPCRWTEAVTGSASAGIVGPVAGSAAVSGPALAPLACQDDQMTRTSLRAGTDARIHHHCLLHGGPLHHYGSAPLGGGSPESHGSFCHHPHLFFRHSCFHASLALSLFHKQIIPSINSYDFYNIQNIVNSSETTARWH